MANKEKFDYTYSAPTEAERREIEGIRTQYAPSLTKPLQKPYETPKKETQNGNTDGVQSRQSKPKECIDMETKQRAERICAKYASRPVSKLDELRALDKKVYTPPAVFAYVFGCIAVLIFGTGMCLCMQVIGTTVLTKTTSLILGSVVGCAGAALCVGNYYLYKALLRGRKAKYAPQILALGDELLHEDKAD